MNPHGFTIVFRPKPHRTALSGTTSSWVQKLKAQPVLQGRRVMSSTRPSSPLTDVYTASAGDMNEAAALLDQLQSDASIETAYIAPPRYVLSERSPQTTATAGGANGLFALIDLDKAKTLTQWNGQHAVRVAIVDSGCDIQHAQLGHIAWVEHLIPPQAAPDTLGHGSHVAGLMAASAHAGNTFEGLAGPAAQVTVHRCMMQVYDVAAYYRALDAACEDSHIVSLSIGGEGEDPLETETIQRALDDGTIVVAAMGNAGEMGSPDHYPAKLEGVLAVGAVDAQGKRAPSSNEGDHLYVCAPGVDVESTVPTYPCANISPYGTPPLATMSGTSMATPVVSALIARLLAWKPDLTRAQVFDLIQVTGNDWNPETGWGVINAHKLLSAV